MNINALTTSFERHYNKSIHVDSKDIQEDTTFDQFELHDTDASGSAFAEPGEGTALYRNSAQDLVQIIKYEKFINRHNRGNTANLRRCDYIIVDEARSLIIFDELTITQDKYLKSDRDDYGKERIGKFEHAHEQLKGSILSLIAVNEISNKINSYHKKIAMLSYRDPDFKDNVMGNNAKRFMQIVSKKKITYDRNQDADTGFTFGRQPYPAALRIS